MKYLLTLIACSLILTGCQAKTEPVPEKPEINKEAETEEVPEVPEAEVPGQMITLYAPNDDVSGFVTTEAELSELSGPAIFEAMVEAGILNDAVMLNALEVEEGQIKLDLNEAFATQVRSYGTSGEYLIIGGVVNTLLEAFDAEAVSLTVDGELLETGHNVYDYPLEFHE